MNSNRQLFDRLTVYVIVFVLVSVSYFNFEKNRENTLTGEPDIVEFDTTKAVEAPAEPEEEIEELDESMVLGEIDIEDFVAQEEVVEEES